MPCESVDAAAQQLEQQGFPPFFIDVLYGRQEQHGRDLEIFFEQPEEFYRLIKESPRDFPFAETLIPLRESNYEYFVCYVPEPHGLFIEHSIERRPEEHQVIGRTRDEYAEFELERLWELDLSEDDLRFCAELFGYKPIEELLLKFAG